MDDVLNLVPWPDLTIQVPAQSPLNSFHSQALLYFLLGDTIYCFDQGSQGLSQAISAEVQGNHRPVPGVPTPVPPTFQIGGISYMRTTPPERFLLHVHAGLSGTWAPVTLFEDLREANLERSRIFGAFDALSGLVNNDSGMGPDSTNEVKSNPVLKVTRTDPSTDPSPNNKECTAQPQLQIDTPFYLKDRACKEEIDEYCRKLQRGGYRNNRCPFCCGMHDRVSSLKRHLYFRFRINAYICAKGCDQKFSTPDNERRHSKSCKGLPKGHQSRPKSEWIPRCQPSTRKGLRQ